MKLELKEVKNYLDCNVKIARLDSNGNYKRIDGLLTTKSIGDVLRYNNLKLVLRPLSDLTKEKQIAEYYCSFYDHLERINPSTHETKNCALMLDGSIEMQYYNDYQFLFEWHFDVFGLIEKGLAIDINTIEI